MQLREVDFASAPAEGYMIAYFRGGVVNGRYRMSDGKPCGNWTMVTDEEMLLELHMFNPEKEFRVVVRTNDEPIYAEILKEAEGQDYYEEHMLLHTPLNEPQQYLVVRSHVGYDENDMIEIKNYRLVDVRYVGEGE